MKQEIYLLRTELNAKIRALEGEQERKTLSWMDDIKKIRNDVE